MHNILIYCKENKIDNTTIKKNVFWRRETVSEDQLGIRFLFEFDVGEVFPKVLRGGGVRLMLASKLTKYKLG